MLGQEFGIVPLLRARAPDLAMHTIMIWFVVAHISYAGPSYMVLHTIMVLFGIAPLSHAGSPFLALYAVDLAL